MTDLEQLITDHLDARADRVPVGPAPVDSMVRAAVVRRRRPYVALAAAAAVAVVATGVAVVGPSLERDSAPPLAPAPTPTKRVGIGHLSVAVPMTWSRDVSRCGTALEDTLLTYALSRSCRIDILRPGVESVQIVTEDPVLDDRPVARVQVDGVPALRAATACDYSVGRICQARLWLPSESVGLIVSSTTDEATVDAILATAGFDRARVAVPVPHRLSDGVPLRLGRYSRRLEETGLRGELAQVGDGLDVLAVSPEPGTVVPVGSTVRVEFGTSSSSAS